MSRLRFAAALALLCTVLVGCDSPFGQQVPDCDVRPDLPGCQGTGGCASNAQCAAPEPVCDLEGAKECVQCLPDQAGECRDAQPICGDDHACRACNVHSECGLGACLPGGACADESQIAYVTANGAGTTAGGCSREAPCDTLAEAIATPKAVVKLTGEITHDTAVIVITRKVTIVAESGAKLDRTGDGATIEVRDAADVEIVDLEISGASGGGGGGIGISVVPGGATKIVLTRVRIAENTGSGIFASGGAVTVSRSTLSSNLGGGISITNGATFQIVGNAFFDNGTPSGNFGGVLINTSENSANRLEFNSFSLNRAQNSKGRAMDCSAGDFTARNNILSDETTTPQFTGDCKHAYSIVRPGTVPDGVMNSGVDPMFEDFMIGNLHLKAGSPALGAADPNSVLTGIAEHDIDGDRRTGRADIGVDEVP